MSASPEKGKANKLPLPVLFAVEKLSEQAVEVKEDLGEPSENP